MDVLTSENESYDQRRKLFKNIWDTAMNIKDKETANDVLNKPKVIKTLRLDSVDRQVVGKKKKQRIRNLRTVCNKILDFCDRQDAEDLFYEQMGATAAANNISCEDINPILNINGGVKKRRKIKTKHSKPRTKPMPREKRTNELFHVEVNKFENPIAPIKKKHSKKKSSSGSKIKPKICLQSSETNIDNAGKKRKVNQTIRKSLSARIKNKMW